MEKNIVLITLLAALTFTIAVIVAEVGFTVQPAYALIVPTCQNCGASELAPGEEGTKFPGDAQNFAPGQEAKIGVPCNECAKDFAPGQEGLKEGIIGPE